MDFSFEVRLKDIFNFFSGGPSLLKVKPDRVWLSNADRCRGFASAAQDPSEERELSVVVAHFPSTIRESAEALAGALQVVGVESLNELRAAVKAPGSPPPVIIIPVKALTGLAILALGLPALTSSFTQVRISVWGRHFLREYDDLVIAFGKNLAVPAKVAFHLTLDDELLRIFVNESVMSFLRGSAGANPWIESKMVSKSFAKAQARMLERTHSRLEAESPAEWLSRNTTR
jgi:hypothetical protein